MEDDIQQAEPSSSSLRRAFTMRNNAARQVAVNFMPSRQIPYNTLKLRRNNSDHNALLEELLAKDTDDRQSPQQQADIIVREMEQNQQLMEDNPEAEELRREALRELHHGMTTKRQVRAKLSNSVSLRSKRKQLSLWKRFKYRISFANKRVRDRLRNFVFSIELWYEAIRKIEGNYGSAVGSYFYFLRWLFVFNFVLMVLQVSFIVVPQSIHNTRTNRTEDGGWNILDFISGKGRFADSLLFYGHYHADDIASTGFNYNMPFAYFFTMVSLYLLFFGVLLYRTAYSYRVNFIDTSGGVRHVYANKVFCGWDFGIAEPRAASLHARSICNELKELLYEQNRRSVKTPLCTKIGQYLANILVTCLVLAFMALMEYGIWMLLSWEVDVQHWELIVSTLITVVVSASPIVFNNVVKLEFYTPRVALYVTLSRIFLIDMSTLFLLLFFWNKPTVFCWETSFGQETYRLVLLEAFYSLALLPLFELLRGLFFKLCPKGPAPEFNIAYNSLSLIYNQAVLWFGMLFSPLLVVAVTLKMLCLFYVKKSVVMYASVPSRKVWRAAQTQTVMYMLVTLSLFTTLFGLGTLYFRMSSQQCGPFTQYQYVYSVLTEGALSLSSRPVLTSILMFITKKGVIGFIMVTLCVLVYYTKARSQAQRSMVNLLRQMLVLEAKDKDFLLSAINKVANGEWLYTQDGTPQPDTHTWKYLHDENVKKPSNAGFHFDGSRINHSGLDSSRPRSYVSKGRPNSYFSSKVNDGETDSSFSWQGSSSQLQDPRGSVEEGSSKWL